MKRIAILVFLIAISNLFSIAQFENFRAPSYPIITHDPYFSIWINDEVPTRMETMHWTQKPMPIRSMVRIDGKVYRLMGKSPGYIPSAKFAGTKFSPTKTTFNYVQTGIEIKLNFLSPLLVDDIDLVSRPVSFVTWEFKAVDNKEHDVEIYFEVSGLVAANTKRQSVTFSKGRKKKLQILKLGTTDQPILEKSGDDLRIDWGYLYLAADSSNIKSSFAGRSETAMEAFVNDKIFPEIREHEQNKRLNELNQVLVLNLPVRVTPKQPIEKYVMVAYDDIYSVEYFGERLKAYWYKKFDKIEELLETSEKEYPLIKKRCKDFDDSLMLTASQLGGEKYAIICALAHRQCMAAHKIVMDKNSNPLCFSKENFSNGSMGTVDVFYPASPYFLYLNTELMKAQTTPIFEYAESGRWPWPYAPHDIGKYPLGNGQKYGGGEESEDRQMPVEECGNMLIVTAAIAKVDGNADYAEKYWGTIAKWAEYLKDKGFDPENQLCTDDFAGHLAHNTNLSVKAIMGIASYAMLCEMQGLNDQSNEFMTLAEAMVKDWIKAADDGDHFRLAFDKPGTWSQKYNMVWDDLLGFNLFPREVKNKEIKYYLKNQNRYGLPLDNRETYTKLDWIFWTASMANNNDKFKELISTVYDFLHETPDRVPMTDWYWTKSGEMRGFVARSVVGGVYMEMLKDKINRQPGN